MNEHVQDAEAIFLSALEKATPAERVAYIEATCEGNVDLLRRVRELLASHDQSRGPLDSPPPGLVGTMEMPTTSERPGTIIGPYKLLQQIGEGGMGVVYMAEQSQPVHRKVALKIIKPGMDSKQVIARFEAERQALAMMDHVNIARVIDGGTTESGRLYFVMELINGVPITKYCDDNHLTPRERLELFVPVCQAIQHAHQKGIIHRDIKPSNVLVTIYEGKPVPKVIDFGVAKAIDQKLTEHTLCTNFGIMVGTLEYMSPEQAEMSALGVDTRSDIYSLGVLLYELLTGSTPLTRKQLKHAANLEILRLIKEEEPQKPSTRLSESGDALSSISAQRHMEPAKLTKLVRGELDWIVMKTLEKDRNRRYETANGLAVDVQRYLADEPVQACPPSKWYRVGKFVRRNKGPVMAAAAIILLLFSGIIGTTWGLLEANHQRDTAIAAAVAEKKANDQSQKRLTQIEKSNEILGSIFKKLDPESEEKEDKSLRVLLGEKLDAAVKQLDGEAVGDPLVVARLQMILGEALLNLGYPEKAIELYSKARKTLEDQLEKDHRETLECKNGLGLGYAYTGKIDRALPFLEETAKAAKDKLGSDDRTTLLFMNNLACGYFSAGKFEQAFPLIEETLKLQKANLGTDDQDTLQSMNNLGMFYLSTRKWNLALPLLEETLKLYEAKKGPDHPATLTTLNNLASCHSEMENLELAIPLLDRSLKLAKKKWGPDHSNTLAAMNNLAHGYKKKGDLPSALPLLEEVLKRSKSPLCSDQPDILQNLCFGYETLKQFEKAETWRRKWLTAAREFTGDNSMLIADALAKLGQNLLLQQKCVDAEAILKQCIALYQKHSPKDWARFHVESLLGDSLMGQKKYVEAEPLLLAGYAGLVASKDKLPLSASARPAEVGERLIQLFEAMNQPEKAQTWREKLRHEKPSVK